MLIIFGVWRHIYRKHTVRYEPTMWNMMLVLGMYSAATRDISHLLNITTLEYLSAVFFLVAVAAWMLTRINFAISPRTRRTIKFQLHATDSGRSDF